GTTARPKVTAETVQAPAWSSARAASASVAPVVKTSSTRTRGRPNAEFGLPSFRIPHSAFRISNAPATFASRASGVNAVCAAVSRVARPPDEPHRGSRPPARRRPLGAQPASPELRLGLPATGAPRRANGAPAVTAHVADQPGGIAEREEGAAQQALGWEEELLDGL